MYLRTLLLTAILVPFMVYVAMPTAKRRFAGWLEPDHRFR